MKRVFALIIFLILLSSCMPAQTEVMNPKNVYYSGGEGGVKTALSLAGYAVVDDPARADVFVLNGEIQGEAGIVQRVKDGAGLVLILGEDISEGDVQKLLGMPVTVTSENEALSLVDAPGMDDPIVEEVAEASRMTGFLRPVVRVVFEIPSRWGAKLSPLHNRFPIKMRDMAMIEAQALTEERVKLVEA